MDNNDILIRLRYALDIPDRDMVRIFKKGDIDISLEEVSKMLTRNDDGKAVMECSNFFLESFLNGLIVEKRGVLKSKTGEVVKGTLDLKEGMVPNNTLLKKVKIALSLSSEDVLDIFAKADIKIGKSELGAFFRNEEHKNYRVCMDMYARGFLKGLAIVYRK